MTVTDLIPVRQQPARGRLEGVNLGQILARAIETELQFEAVPRLDHDTSTAALIRRYLTARGRPA